MSAATVAKKENTPAKRKLNVSAEKIENLLPALISSADKNNHSYNDSVDTILAHIDEDLDSDREGVRSYCQEKKNMIDDPSPYSEEFVSSKT
jgi:hypothetical protein